RRIESPLPHGVDRTFIEARAEPFQQLHAADCAVATHDDFEDDVTLDVTAAGLLRLVRFSFTLDRGSPDAACSAIWPPAQSSAGTRPDARTLTFSDARPLTGSGASACAWAATVRDRRGRGRGPRNAGTIARIVRFGDDRSDDLWNRLRRIDLPDEGRRINDRR